jgi:hypothetical protein
MRTKRTVPASQREPIRTQEAASAEYQATAKTDQASGFLQWPTRNRIDCPLAHNAAT